MELLRLIDALPPAGALRAQPRPYMNHAVVSTPMYTARERAEMLEHVGLNVFSFPSEMVSGCDLLSDSGTTAMTNEQWAALHLGDEAYGSNRGFYVLMDQIRRTFGRAFFNDPAGGHPNAFLFHQGRACESALFTLIARQREGQVVPNNGHFDTTLANIEANGMQALNLPVCAADMPAGQRAFRGNMDVEQLRELLSTRRAEVPLVLLTITNNSGGGHPVSMANIRAVAEVCHEHQVPLFFDACRFAENAWFIKQLEQGYANREVIEIVHEMFSHVDGFTISFKKDGLANMGGGLFLRDNGLFRERYPEMSDALVNWQILREGHPSYGGMSGRDLMALSKGLDTVTIEGYLSYRIGQVREFGEAMLRHGIQVVEPIGGHAVYVDLNRFFEGTAMRPEEYGGISLCAVLLAAYGHRACELGNFAFGAFDPETGEERYPANNFLRFAVPRLRYEKQDLDSVAEAMRALHEQRNTLPGVSVVYGRDLPLRHFKARFELRPRTGQASARAL